MEPLGAVTLLAFLDPVRALITFACSFLSRKAYGVLIAAAASAIVCETVLTMAHVSRFWGQGIVAGFIASLLQAVALYWAVKAMRLRRRRVASVRESRATT
jgi:hypothetical protein